MICAICNKRNAVSTEYDLIVERCEPCFQELRLMTRRKRKMPKEHVYDDPKLLRSDKWRPSLYYWEVIQAYEHG